MTLPSGSKLGPYEIVGPLGVGGMGEVYRGRDAKLGRDVALKVLPEAFALDAERMARFEREAKVLASLNHPNIASIYGLDDSGSTRALVMELVEGPTLSDRIKAGAIPIDEVLRIAKQICEGLEYAHDRGIVHRDLKPANVKMTSDDSVKILDFGLAKALEGDASSIDLSTSPTLSRMATQAGVLLGTAAYMSPEQAKGKPVDRRTDIWAFGCVMYEMLTGLMTFRGESVTDALAAVIKEEPDWTQLPATTPIRVRVLLQRCLQKNPKQRLQAIGDARISLDEVLAGAPDPAIGGEAQITAPGWRRALPWAVAGVLAVALAIVGWGWWRAPRAVEQPLVRLDVDLGPDISLAAPSSAGSSVIISPDGTRLAYLASVSGSKPRLFVRKLDQPKAKELAGTEGAVAPFFSPDGHWIGFSIGSKSSKISVEGGAVVPLAGEVDAPASSWGEDGVVTGRYGKGLIRTPLGGGAPVPLTQIASGERIHAYPKILPGGEAVLFVSYHQGGGPDGANIEVVSSKDHQRKTLISRAASPHYVPNGYLVYVQKGTLFAVAFDPNKLETLGNAVPILDDVATSGSGSGEFDISEEPAGSGTLVYRKGEGAGRPPMMTVQWLDSTGRKGPLIGKPGDYMAPRLSPDGKQLALPIDQGGTSDIWVYNQHQDTMRRLTSGGGYYSNPVWSPDGQYVVFGSYADGMFWSRADGAVQLQPLALPRTISYPMSFSPDGKRLAYEEFNNASSSTGGIMQIWTVPIEENGGQLQAGKPEQFLKTQFRDTAPAFSPDGRWIAYVSNASGVNQVYVRAFPPPESGQGGQWQISNSDGISPVWSRDGHELLYRSGDQIMAAGYSVKDNVFVAEKPRLWATKLGGATHFDLSPDGKRLIVLAPVDPPQAPKAEHEVTFLFNFFDELRRKVPKK